MKRPAIGTLPPTMRAALIRRERYGAPEHAFRIEQVPVPVVGRRQVLVAVMAAGINYNGVWAARGLPVDLIAMRQRHGDDEIYHIAGSDASGVVAAIGADVTDVHVGDEIIISCGQYGSADGIHDRSRSTAGSEIWGYETNYGAFAEYTVVYDYQCHRKPTGLSWEEAACFLLTAATAYHQLRGWPPHVVGEGDPVLIWGASGGLGTAAIQIVRHFGGIPIAVTSSPERARYCRDLGAEVINRSGFTHWGSIPDPTEVEAWEQWLGEVRRFGAAIWGALGTRRSPRIVLEHPGGDTLATSVYVCDGDGMIVTCGATSGYLATVDLRFLWMRQKRLQGSHFATVAECDALLALVQAAALRPCLSRVFELDEIGRAHQLMFDNLHPPGNMAVRIGAGRDGAPAAS